MFDRTKKYRFTVEGVDGRVILKPLKESGYFSAEVYYKGKLVKSSKRVKLQIAEMNQSDYTD